MEHQLSLTVGLISAFTKGLPPRCPAWSCLKCSLCLWLTGFWLPLGPHHQATSIPIGHPHIPPGVLSAVPPDTQFLSWNTKCHCPFWVPSPLPRAGRQQGRGHEVKECQEVLGTMREIREPCSCGGGCPRSPQCCAVDFFSP